MGGGDPIREGERQRPAMHVHQEQMDAFMKERIRVYTGVAKQMGLAK